MRSKTDKKANLQIIKSPNYQLPGFSGQLFLQLIPYIVSSFR